MGREVSALLGLVVMFAATIFDPVAQLSVESPAVCALSALHRDAVVFQDDLEKPVSSVMFGRQIADSRFVRAGAEINVDAGMTNVNQRFHFLDNRFLVRPNRTMASWIQDRCCRHATDVASLVAFANFRRPLAIIANVEPPIGSAFSAIRHRNEVGDDFNEYPGTLYGLGVFVRPSQLASLLVSDENQTTSKDNKPSREERYGIGHGSVPKWFWFLPFLSVLSGLFGSYLVDRFYVGRTR